MCVCSSAYARSARFRGGLSSSHFFADQDERVVTFAVVLSRSDAAASRPSAESSNPDPCAADLTPMPRAYLSRQETGGSNAGIYVYVTVDV